MLFVLNWFVMDWVNEKYLWCIEEVFKDLNGGQVFWVNMKVGLVLCNSELVICVEELVWLVMFVQEESGSQVIEEEKGVVVSVGVDIVVCFKVVSECWLVQVEGDIKYQSFLNEGFIFEIFVEGKFN